MLVAGGVALLVAIRLEQRRRRDMRAFFMAFTHDLKTSLTSLRLQAEALARRPAAGGGEPEPAAPAEGLGAPAAAVRECAGADHGRRRRVHRSDRAAPAGRVPAGGFPELTIEAHRRRARARRSARAGERPPQPAAERRRARPRVTRSRSMCDARPPAPSRSSSPTTAAARRWTSATVLDRPFVRPTETSGSGVGLYVCGRLLQQMHGQMRLSAGGLRALPSASSCRRRSDVARVARRG